MRRSIDDAVDDHPEGDEDRAPASWAVGMSDDCEACADLRVVLTVEEQGRAGYGVVAHLAPAGARRLRVALAAGAAGAGRGPWPVNDADLHPGAVLGALADQARLRVLAAVALGATDVAGVAAAAGLTIEAAAKKVDRLVAAGLVAAGAGGLTVRHDVLASVARTASRMQRVVDPEDLGATPEQAAVIRGFFANGRISHLPAQRSKRLVLLDVVANRFEPGRVYPEQELSFELAKLHRDYAALRRALIDDGLFERRDGFYWRSGGTFEVD